MRECYELVADCRLRAATDLFLPTWNPVVLAALRAGPCRRVELRAAIGGISAKVLGETLRRLLGHRLIERRPYVVAPSCVDFALTRSGAASSTARCAPSGTGSSGTARSWCR